MTGFSSIEICAGAGGQALGLQQAGFEHLALVEIDSDAVETLKLNFERRAGWERDHCDILSADVRTFDPLRDLDPANLARLRHHDLDLLAGGVPCPPFSYAGKQLGKDDERDLFPRMLELVELLKPRAVMIENVRGIMDPKFSSYRDWITAKLEGGMHFGDNGQFIDEVGLGYTVSKWDILEAHDFGVPQLRPRAILVAFRNDVIKNATYQWPARTNSVPVTFAGSLEKSMHERFSRYFDGSSWGDARESFARWLRKAREHGGVAPTLVGGSKKHGGADLGPSRAKAAWRQLGVDPMGVANDIETSAVKGTEERDLFRPDGPMLTVQQAAIIQGFPLEWQFSGGKTAQYRQVGNAFPPPVARAVGESIIEVLKASRAADRLAS
ncbi:DNA cytosine methyltransferase [Nocardia sp. NPDC059240]|uniref:DNA cytosine methyltransferase n=1 Tax=Nocardia sp. NPDC059240 TaxID=3346786 RepID=UPI0036C60B29